jgi:hypothetical protein
MTRSATLGVPDNLGWAWAHPSIGLWPRAREYSPEQKLLVAMIANAPADYLRPASRLDTFRWVCAEAPRPGPFSFEYVCAALDLDIARTRKNLLRIFRQLAERQGIGRADGSARVRGVWKQPQKR